MSVQALTPPLDITWTRMAFSRDMVDTEFADATFGPKWRSSLAVYYYIVPEEETADNYPTSRIMYLKFTCSITGYNPSESLADVKQIVEESGALDDLQRSTWEVISGSGWSAKYWPCLGAIMQLAVYPGAGDDVGPDDYPYILDFEPKKREIYEAVSEGKENLSGSAGKTEITKGSTSVSGLEIGGSAGFSIGGFGASGSVTHTSSDTTINQNTTDTSREARETLSRTTQSSQLYQLFNGYHLGSNRALFVVAPRPHTVSDQAQTEFNLIDGARKLEGVQEVFVIVHMPKSLTGFCLQAGLDTGHQVSTLVPYQALARRRVDDGGPPLPNGGPEIPPVPPPNPPDPPPSTPIRQLVVTRRSGAELRDVRRERPAPHRPARRATAPAAGARGDRDLRCGHPAGLCHAGEGPLAGQQGERGRHPQRGAEPGQPPDAGPQHVGRLPAARVGGDRHVPVAGGQRGARGHHYDQ